MTTIITRLYSDEATARAVQGELTAAGFPESRTDVIGEGADARSAMVAAQVPADSAATYADAMAPGNALIVVRAPVVPFGIARKAMGIVDAHGPLDAGVANENVYLREDGGTGTDSGATSRMVAKNVNTDHPLYLTPKPDSGSWRKGTITDKYGFKLLSPHRETRSVMPDAPFMSQKFWPAPLLSKTERKPSVLPGAPFMSTKFWPAPLLSKGERQLSVSRGKRFPFSETLGLDLLIRR